MFLLQEVIGALDTAPVGKNSMTSSQGAPCVSKVKLMQTFSLPATLHIPIITQLAGSATICCNYWCYRSRIDHLVLFIDIESSNCFVCLSGQPSRAKQNARRPNAAHVCQAAFIQSPPLPWSQPVVKATVMEHSGPPAHHIRCQVSF